MNLELSNEAYAIIDAIAIPDELLGAPIGYSDGNMYKRFLTLVKSAPGCQSRPEWWEDLKTSK